MRKAAGFGGLESVPFASAPKQSHSTEKFPVQREQKAKTTPPHTPKPKKEFML